MNRKDMNRRGIPQEQQWRVNSFNGKPRNARGVKIVEWVEPEGYRKWVKYIDRMPTKDGRYVVQWSDGMCGFVTYTKKAGFATGVRVVFWSHDLKEYVSQRPRVGGGTPTKSK